MLFADDEIAVLGYAAPVLLKILARREQSILDRMRGEFRSGKTEHTANLAEYCSVRDQINEITAALRAREKEPRATS